MTTIILIDYIVSKELLISIKSLNFAKLLFNITFLNVKELAKVVTIT